MSSWPTQLAVPKARQSSLGWQGITEDELCVCAGSTSKRQKPSDRSASLNLISWSSGADGVKCNAVSMILRALCWKRSCLGAAPGGDRLSCSAMTLRVVRALALLCCCRKQRARLTAASDSALPRDPLALQVSLRILALTPLRCEATACWVTVVPLQSASCSHSELERSLCSQVSMSGGVAGSPSCLAGSTSTSQERAFLAESTWERTKSWTVVRCCFIGLVHNFVLSRAS